MINLYNLTLNTTLVLKVIFVLLTLVFILFGFLLKRQVELLDQFLKTPLGKWARIASIFYLVTAMASLGLVLVLL